MWTRWNTKQSRLKYYWKPWVFAQKHPQCLLLWRKINISPHYRTPIYRTSASPKNLVSVMFSMSSCVRAFSAGASSRMLPYLRRIEYRTRQVSRNDFFIQHVHSVIALAANLIYLWNSWNTTATGADLSNINPSSQIYLPISNLAYPLSPITSSNLPWFMRIRMKWHVVSLYQSSSSQSHVFLSHCCIITILLKHFHLSQKLWEENQMVHLLNYLNN